MWDVHRSRGGTTFVSASSPATSLMNVLPRRPPAESTFLKQSAGSRIHRVNGRSVLSLLGSSMRGSFTRLSRWETRRLDDSSPPLVAFVSVPHHNPFSMVHHRRQIRRPCAARGARGPLRPRNLNERLPAQKVDLMVSSVPRSEARGRKQSSSPFVENCLPI